MKVLNLYAGIGGNRITIDITTQEDNREFVFGIPNYELGYFIKGFNFSLEKISAYLLG